MRILFMGTPDIAMHLELVAAFSSKKTLSAA